MRYRFFYVADDSMIGYLVNDSTCPDSLLLFPSSFPCWSRSSQAGLYSPTMGNSDLRCMLLLLLVYDFRLAERGQRKK